MTLRLVATTTAASILVVVFTTACSTSSATDDEPRGRDASGASGNPTVTSSGRSDAAGIASLGRIEPRSRARKLGAPYTDLGPPIVGELRVDVGDRVSAGEVVATLASTPVRDAEARRAESAVEVARRQLRVVTSGEKVGTIEAQRAEVARLEAELANAEIELQRRRELHRDQVISTADLDAYALVADQRRALLLAGRKLLEAVAEVRPVEVELARAELDQAIAASERVRADYELTLVRSPIAGEVLAVSSRPGEMVGADGIVEIGDLDDIIVVAEVYATDVGRVRVGAPAEITAEFLPAPIQGKVSRIGRTIRANATLDRDPSAFADRRVIEVDIDVVGGERLAGLVHGEVRVRIDDQGSSAAPTAPATGRENGAGS